ncbi:hypothetical protein BG910_10585 [Neisseria chenwenguii]|uniref:LysR substrate-binding domain-containing protein n=1 Tax=Neisseria chenwenguii TaxID=1853278 RepID=A0A220S3R3_9NEIS|nr:hypothetical protein BG910_10585 [Neisseria chenwenguii]
MCRCSCLFRPIRHAACTRVTGGFPALLAGRADTDGSRSVREFGAQKIKSEYLFSSNANRAIWHYTLAGMAIGKLSDLMAAPYLARGELVQVLPDYPLPCYPLHLIYAAYRHPLAIVRAYVDFCAAWFEENGHAV